MSTSSRHFIRVLTIFTFIVFGSIFFGMWIIGELIPNPNKIKFASTAGMTMFLVSFVWAMIAWQGRYIINVFFGIIGKILTLGMSRMDPPHHFEIPPSSWKLVTNAGMVCGAYGLIIGLLNPEIKILLTAFDFLIVGACWGSILNFLARFGWLPIVPIEEFPKNF